jgi:hypothetical protein
LLKLGNHPEMTIDQARELRKTVIALGVKGIDPTEGLHERLIRELLAKGTHARDDLSARRSSRSVALCPATVNPPSTNAAGKLRFMPFWGRAS